MIKNASFSYCLLQYVHKPWLKERLNVGVLLHCEPHNFLKLKVRSWDGRISAAFPDLNKAHFTEDLKQIERSLKRFSRLNPEQLSLFTSRSHKDDKFETSEGSGAEWIASIAAPASDSSYRWAKGGVGLCSSPEQRLSSIFERFVCPYEQPKKPSKRSDDQVWSSVSELLLKRNLAAHIEPDPIVKTDLGPIKFQAGYQNGEYHVIQSLSFDLSDEENIGGKAAKWGGFAQALSSASSKNVAAQFVLGAPTNPDLQKSFYSAAKYLKNYVGAENVYEERQTEILVDRIEEDLSPHRIN